MFFTENFNIADIYEEREVEEEGQIYYSSDSDNLAIQLDHVITSTEETELLLAQAQAERETAAQKGQSTVKKEHLAPDEHSYSNPTPATITRAPTFTLPNSKGKKRGLRHPKIEIVETHSLFEDSENIAPAKPLEQLPVKTEQLPPPPEVPSQSRGFWLTPSQIDWARLNRDNTHQRDPTDTRENRSWESVYDSFYTHPVDHPSTGERLGARMNNSQSGDCTSESEQTSDQTRSSISVGCERYHTTNPPIQPRLAHQACLSYSHRDYHDDCYFQQRQHDRVNINAYAEADHQPPRRPSTRQRRPLSDQTAPTLSRQRNRRNSRALDDAWLLSSHGGYTAHVPPHCHELSRDSSPNITNTSVRYHSPERNCDPTLSEVCWQVESLRREVRELRNLTPRRRNYAFPRPPIWR